MIPPSAGTAYDRLARWYDLVSLPERGLKRRAVALLAPRPGERVLVVGSGTGQELVALARHGAWALGVDRACGMCRRALARTAPFPLAAPVCADALRLPVAPGSSDAALLVFTLELFDAAAMRLVLGQIGQALRPGGRLVVACLSRRRPTAMVRLYEWFHRRWPRVIDCRPILVAPLLEAAGWQVARLQGASLGGLPVDLALAQRPGPPVVAG